jgi:hypothetical protein
MTAPFAIESDVTIHNPVLRRVLLSIKRQADDPLLGDLVVRDDAPRL